MLAGTAVPTKTRSVAMCWRDHKRDQGHHRRLIAIRERRGVTAAAPRRIASPRPGECGGFAPATRRHPHSRPERPAREDVAWIVHPQVHPRVCDTGSERQQHRARFRQLPRGRDRKRERRRGVAGGKRRRAGRVPKPTPWGGTLSTGQQLHGPVDRRRCDSEREEAAVCRTLAAGPPNQRERSRESDPQHRAVG